MIRNVYFPIFSYIALLRNFQKLLIEELAKNYEALNIVRQAKFLVKDAFKKHLKIII